MKRKNPHLLELNAFLFLERMSRKHGSRLSLVEIPEEEWAAIAAQGFDYVWLMGVWMRSPEGRQRALEESGLCEAYEKALPDWTDDDVPGSPYAVYYYEIDPRLGSEGDLQKLRARMRRAGLGLILDFVSNHMALDHLWTSTRPDCFIRADAEACRREPDLFFETPQGRFFAHGRDPYFPAWTDTVQTNYFSETWRKGAVEILLSLAEVSDGVRCDMAMLAIHQVFENVWGRFLGAMPRPQKEFWQEVIQEVKTKHPDFIFMAEAYWDLEWNLQQLGFDFTYDKRFYDRLLNAPPEDIRGHLRAEKVYQEKSVRFIENHDEARAAAAFGKAKSLAAAVAVMTVPGMRFIHEGQAAGRKIHLPVQLAREPEEVQDAEISGFYKKLFGFAAQETLHRGEWKLLEALPEGGEDRSFESLLAWSWRDGKNLRLIIVNYSSAVARGRLKFSADWMGHSGTAQLLDQLSGVIYQEEISRGVDAGFQIRLEPWKAHLFEVKKIFESVGSSRKA